MNYRSKANITLTVVLIVFIMFALLKHFYPANQGVRFFFFVSEASLVGGIADWFAVTALFRKPLGWPYHTELIPRNRAKMIEGVVRLVEDQLLSQQMIRQKITGLKASSWLISYGDQAGGASYLAHRLEQRLKQALKHKVSSDSEPASVTHIRALAGQLTKLLEGRLTKADLASPALEKTQDLIRGQLFVRGLDKLLDLGIEKASQPAARSLLHRALEQIQQEKVSQSGTLEKAIFGLLQASNAINLEEAAEVLQIELILHLKEIRLNPGHPVREQLKAAMGDRIEECLNAPLALEKLDSWKNNLLGQLNLEPSIERLLANLAEGLEDGRLPSGLPLGEALQPWLEDWWQHFKEDTALQNGFDELVRDLLLGTLRREHTLIGQIVRETLESLSGEDLNRFIEDKAGDDLQWIRMNGSLVGGLVGVLLFLLLNYGYSPLLQAWR